MHLRYPFPKVWQCALFDGNKHWLLHAALDYSKASCLAIGYVVGLQFSQMIQNWDHWIAFVLLALIGVNMIREGLSSNDEPAPSLISLKRLLTLGVATSIDALAIGVSFAFLSVDILLAVFIIGLTTFVISFIGVKSGHFLGKKFKSKAEIFGGLVLLVIAVKILHEHGVF